MTTEVDRVRAILIESCDRWLAAGKRLAPGMFRGEDGCACALGTLACLDSFPESGSFTMQVADHLGIGFIDVTYIAVGFDKARALGRPSHWYDLGAELRARYLGGGK